MANKVTSRKNHVRLLWCSGLYASELVDVAIRVWGKTSHRQRSLPIGFSKKVCFFSCAERRTSHQLISHCFECKERDRNHWQDSESSWCWCRSEALWNSGVPRLTFCHNALNLTHSCFLGNHWNKLWWETGPGILAAIQLTSLSSDKLELLWYSLIQLSNILLLALFGAYGGKESIKGQTTLRH